MSRDFRLLVFFHESLSPKPLSIPLGPFQIFLIICGDIRSSRCTTGVVDTGGKWKKSAITKVLIILFGHLWEVYLLIDTFLPLCRWYRWCTFKLRFRLTQFFSLSQLCPSHVMTMNVIFGPKAFSHLCWVTQRRKSMDRRKMGIGVEAELQQPRLAWSQLGNFTNNLPNDKDKDWSSVADPWHFDVDLDPWIHASG